jgi:predicted small lipoprotein YifL
MLSTTDDRRPDMPRQAMSLAMILAVAAALGLAGCGRKGRLEPPPGQQLVTKDGKTQDPGPEKPKKPFFLDPLLN